MNKGTCSRKSQLKVYFTPFWRKYNRIGTGVWKTPLPAELMLRRITNTIALSAGYSRIKNWKMGWIIQ